MCGSPAPPETIDAAEADAPEASKVAFPSIDDGALAVTETMPVAEWARTALNKGEFAPLWYFCNDGRLDARERLHTLGAPKIPLYYW